MGFDYTTLDLLRQNHPAWRLLCAQHAPLIAGFLHRVFIEPNNRILPQADLVELLADELFELRERLGPDAYPGTAAGYLNDWAENDKGWLRKFYPTGSDEPCYDLTPATEKALTWLKSLTERAFVGTESRLLTLFDLLRQMSEGSESDPEVRIAELERRREEIDGEIARIRSGDIPMLDETGLRDRFQQFLQMGRELLSDFREVEQNFRQLDRRVRERIARWEGGRGTLLEQIMGERDSIADSDQGRSFRAFWDFLMSQSRQEELSRLLDQALSLESIEAVKPEARLRRIHYDWLEAGEHTQREVAKLSEQLRRFLDDQAWIENRRIMEILHSIENHALEVREQYPRGEFVGLAEMETAIELPLERPLFRPPYRPLISGVALDAGEAEMDLAVLYAQMVIDRMALLGNIRAELRERSQIDLAEVIARHPLRHGLAELVAYLQIASEWPAMTVDEEISDVVHWNTREGGSRRATLPRIILLRR